MTHSKTSKENKKTAHTVRHALSLVATKERAKTNAWFFKTGKGEYGEGDEFIGVTMPNMRRVAHQFQDISFSEIEQLLESKKHEHRMTGLLILVGQYKQGDLLEQKRCVRFYLKNLKCVNNWDLVDTSAPQMVGDYYLHQGGVEKLYTLAHSKNVWRRRVGIVGTFAFIRAGKLQPTLDIAELLLNDRHDLIHKATGWMLREVGKQDKKVLEEFLKKHVAEMPRTMLRYSIERLPEKERKFWLKNKNVEGTT